MAWTYSDWPTYTSGSADRLSRLRLHIQEVTNRLEDGSYAADNGTIIDDRSQNLPSYLTTLLKREKELDKAVRQASGARPLFTRARLKRR